MWDMRRSSAPSQRPAGEFRLPEPGPSFFPAPPPRNAPDEAGEEQMGGVSVVDLQPGNVTAGALPSPALAAPPPAKRKGFCLTSSAPRPSPATIRPPIGGGTMANPGTVPFALKSAGSASEPRGFASPSSGPVSGAATPETTIKASGAPCDDMEVEQPALPGDSIKLEPPDTSAAAPPPPAAPARKSFSVPFTRPNGFAGFKGPSFVAPTAATASSKGGAGGTWGATAEGGSRLTYYEVPPGMRFVVIAQLTTKPGWFPGWSVPGRQLPTEPHGPALRFFHDAFQTLVVNRIPVDPPIRMMSKFVVLGRVAGRPGSGSALQGR